MPSRPLPVGSRGILNKRKIMAKPTKIYAVTQCQKHGKLSDQWEGKQVKCNEIKQVKCNEIPATKKQKLSGCPICKKEKQTSLSMSIAETR